MKLIISMMLTLAIKCNAIGQDASETRVILGVDSSAMLTPAFRKAFRETFSAVLRNAAEGVARVTVIDLAELRPQERLPAWDQAFANGLDKLDRETLSDSGKTQFVSLKLVDGQFVVRSRMANGSLAWLSPSVQEDRTPDRDALVRLALAQVLRDFGISGAIDASDGERSATIALHSGNQADARLAAWVKPGDVFAVVQIEGSAKPTRVPNVLLRVVQEPRDGKVQCRIDSRFVKPLDSWQSGKYRAIKLPAVRGPARVTVSRRQGGLNDALRINLSATGFDRTDALKESGVIRDGRYVSTEEYDRIAYARVFSGDRLLAQVPLEILPGSTVKIELASDGPGNIPDVDIRLIRGRTQDLLKRIEEDNSELRKHLDAGRNPLALQRVNQMLARIDDELPSLITEAAALRQRAGGVAGMDEVDRGVRDASEAQKSLAALKLRLQTAIAAANSPEAIQKREALQLLVARAEHAVDDADYDQAIATYEEILKTSGDWPDAAKRLDELKRGWRIASDVHRAARDQIYNVFAKSASADDFGKNLDVARQSFATCKSVGDQYTSRKLYLVLRRGADVFARRGEELRTTQGDEAKRQRDALAQVSANMSALLTEVENYVRPAKPK